MHEVKVSASDTKITLDRSRKPRGRRGRLDLDAKEAVLRLYASGEATAVIADRFGVDETCVRKLASRYGIRKGVPAIHDVETRTPEKIGGHLPAYKRARRGFDLPERLEPRYIRLLISGLNCTEAARKLGVMDGLHER